jgi:3-oxoacyl-[acyl-carrier-protein] synthase II
MRQVVITGYEAASAFGIGHDVLWSGLVKNRNAIRPIDQFDASTFPVRIAGDVPAFDYDSFAKADLGLFHPLPESRCVRFSLVCAKQAIDMAGFDYRKWSSPDRVGVFIADRETGIAWYLDESAPLQMACLAPQKKEVQLDSYHRRLLATDALRKYRHMDPEKISVVVSKRMGIEGPNVGVGTACASGNDALGQAAQYISEGDMDIAVAGGAFELDLVGMIGFARLEALTFNPDPDSACRPFDRERNGFVMASGCGIVILEEKEHAKRRGARIFGELAGYGNCCDAYRATDPHPDAEGSYRALSGALRNARVRPEQVGYVVAHGTSTKLNDRTETIAIKRALGACAPNIPISASKSMIGHTIMAAGAIQAIIAMKLFETGLIHPTRNLQYPDPECDLNYVPDCAIEKHVEVIASNSFGFGGQNACLVFKRFA